MALTELSVETLGELDGGIFGRLVNKCIQQAIADLEDRGQEDGVTRVVNLRIAMAIDEGRVVIVPEVSVKLPPMRARKTQSTLRIKAGKALVLFQEHDPENPEQETLPEMEE